MPAFGAAFQIAKARQMPKAQSLERLLRLLPGLFLCPGQKPLRRGLLAGNLPVAYSYFAQNMLICINLELCKKSLALLAKSFIIMTVKLDIKTVNISGRYRLFLAAIKVFKALF
jgi:hypothetical protein